MNILCHYACAMYTTSYSSTFSCIHSTDVCTCKSITTNCVSHEMFQSTGLANKVVPRGTALSEAKLLARQLLSFPQMCLRQDRSSAYQLAYSGLPQWDRLRQEFERGTEVLEKESVHGAQRFSSGEGRGGTSNSKL